MPHSAEPSAPGSRPDAAAVVGVVVALDGPSGSGKSTAARALARRLDGAYLDTGAMYRAVCWWALDRAVATTPGAPAEPPSPIARAAGTLDLVVSTDPGAPHVTVEGADVTAAIRTAGVSTHVSTVATDLGVRAALIARQRALVADHVGAGRPVVLEGRDTTTVITPDADVRVLLVADTQARLARRSRERHGDADAASIAATQDEVVRRDRDDSTVAAFTSAADGVVTLDGTHLSVEETVDALAALVTQALALRGGAGRDR